MRAGGCWFGWPFQVRPFLVWLHFTKTDVGFVKYFCFTTLVCNLLSRSCLEYTRVAWLTRQEREQNPDSYQDWSQQQQDAQSISSSCLLLSQGTRWSWNVANGACVDPSEQPTLQQADRYRCHTLPIRAELWRRSAYSKHLPLHPTVGKHICQFSASLGWVCVEIANLQNHRLTLEDLEDSWDRGIPRCTTLYRASISKSIQYTLLLVSNTTLVHWPCTVLGYTGRLVIQ